MPRRSALARALERERGRLLEPPLLVEALAEVGVGPPDAVVVGDLLGDALGLAQHALAAAQSPPPNRVDAEAVERVPLEGARADRARDRDRRSQAARVSSPGARSIRIWASAASTRASAGVGGSGGRTRTASR